MKRINFLCAFLLVIMLIPDLASAQKCPFKSSQIFNRTVQVYSNTMLPATAFFGSGCSYVKVGGSNAPTKCLAAISASRHIFSLHWLDVTARLNGGSTAGCSFMCGGTSKPNTCFVRGSDGLPVELMEFSVDE